MTEPEQWAVELARYVPRPTRLMAAFAIQRAFEERTGQLIPAPSVDDVRITTLEASLAEAKEHTLAAMEEATHFRQALAEAEGRVAELQDLLRIERQHRAAPGPF